MLHEVMSGFEAVTESRAIRLDIPPDLPAVAVDATLIELAMSQVLETALSYSAPGSPVSIRAWRHSDLVVIGVRDRGQGVPAAERARIFEKFFRGSNAAATRGTGIGLAIAREIARAHGG